MTRIKHEIEEQPSVLSNLLDAEVTNVYRIAQAIKDFDPVFIHIAARGSSDNAARYAQYAFGIRLGMAASLATPSIHTLYDAQPRLQRACVIGVSQSGQSEDIRRVVSDAKAQGALTLGITNDPHSPLATLGDYHIDLHCGPEQSVAATKTYTAELAAVAMLVGAMTDTFDTLASIPEIVQNTLSLSANVHEWVARYRYADRLATIGRGYNFSTAHEISLKVKELCYITSEEYSEADFRHGPIALVDAGYPVIMVMPQGRVYDKLFDLLQVLHHKKAECLTISNVDAVAAYAQHHLPIPEMPEWLSPIAAVIPGQQFAWHLASTRGHDVDRPRGLNKVTVTQ